MADDFVATPSTTGRAAVGGSATGQLETVGDRDWFSIILTAGNQYSFKLESAATNGLQDPYLRLFSIGGGTMLAESDDANGLDSQIDITITATGTYYLEAGSGTNPDSQAVGSRMGNYVLSASTNGDDYSGSVATTGRINAGSEATGLLESTGDNDWFAISLTAGKQYIFTLNSGAIDGVTDPALSLYRSDGTLVTSNDDSDGLNSQITYTATGTGTFYLGASSGVNGSGTGTYALNASLPITDTTPTSEDDYTANTATTGTIISGGAATGQLETVGDKDWFSINLSAGKQYIFSLNSGTTDGLADPLLSLYRSDGTLINSNDDFDGLNAQIIYASADSGTYYLAASSGTNGSGTGTYTVNASLPITDDYLATIKTTGQVSAGAAVSGQLETTGDSDWFAVGLTAGSQYTFALNSGTTTGLANPFLSLYSSNGTLITSDDDTNAPNAVITYTATTTGTYYLGASSSQDSLGTGSYTISSSFPIVNGITYVTATGGDDTISIGASNQAIDGGSGTDAVIFSSTRANYAVSRTATGYTIQDNAGSDGTNTVSNVESLRFSDMTVNLTVQAKAAAAPAADVQRLNELYVAFFNRVPDADGLAYWIDQMTGGQSVIQIAESFYNAGVQYSSLTGYSATMSNADFVNVVYRNVLGRTTGADADGLAYWSGELAAGRASHGSLVSDILTSAHTFKNNEEWGWVADLLDNKLTVANKFAVEFGLNYNTPSDSITRGMAIAAAVTSTGTADAISLIGIPDIS